MHLSLDWTKCDPFLAWRRYGHLRENLLFGSSDLWFFFDDWELLDIGVGIVDYDPSLRESLRLRSGDRLRHWGP